MGTQVHQYLRRNLTRAALRPFGEIVLEDELFARESWNVKPMEARLQKRSQASQIGSPGHACQALVPEKAQGSQDQGTIQISETSLRGLLG
jgi:hypothetical protein